MARPAMNKTDLVDKAYLRTDLPEFRPGDTVKVHVRVVEAGRERIQVFQGVVIRRQGGGLQETFTVRKISFGVGVERTFPLHSPSIGKLEVVTARPGPPGQALLPARAAREEGAHQGAAARRARSSPRSRRPRPNARPPPRRLRGGRDRGRARRRPSRRARDEAPTPSAADAEPAAEEPERGEAERRRRRPAEPEPETEVQG